MLTINTLYTQLYTSAINIIYKFTYKLFLYSEIPTVQMQNIHSKYWIQWKNKIVSIVIKLTASIRPHWYWSCLEDYFGYLALFILFFHL
jgi:hypothetical protein